MFYWAAWILLVLFAARHTLNSFETLLVTVVPILITTCLLLYIWRKPTAKINRIFIEWSVILLTACLVVWATYTWAMGWHNI